MALQDNKAEPKAQDSVKAAPSAGGEQKSGKEVKVPAETESGAKTTEKLDPVLKDVQPESNDTETPDVGSKQLATNSLLQTNQTNSPGTISNEGESTGASSDGYGMYIFLGLLLGLFAYLWSKGHLLAFRKYVMETREQLRKCTWPTRDELYQHTVVVLLSTLMMGVFTVLADQTAALLIWDLLLDVPTSVFGKLWSGGA